LFSAFVVCSVPVHAGDVGGYAFRTSANEVRLAFSASNSQGGAIKTLRSSDVAVADNGTIVRSFRSFRPASDGALDLVILLDTSDSVASQLPNEIAELESFLKGATLRDRDRISILAFGGRRPQLVCAWKCNTDVALLKLRNLRVEGATPLYDAISQAAELLKANRDPESRPAMILFSDGVDTISLRSASEALLEAQNLQSAIYSVNSRPKKSAPTEGDVILGYLAGCTGGLSFPPGQNVAAVLSRILDDLKSGYVLTYEPPEQTAGQHSVRILPVSDSRLQLRSRRSYDNTESD
jgi:VWFA-related protein